MDRLSPRVSGYQRLHAQPLGLGGGLEQVLKTIEENKPSVGRFQPTGVWVVQVLHESFYVQLLQLASC